jgi:alkylated DNA nucleotide flippase Atl1
MFGWFRKYIRRIRVFGVEVEFHPPTDTAPTVPAPADGREPDQPIVPSAPFTVAAQPRRDKVHWEKLIAVLREHVGPGQVTTYKECSLCAFDHPDGGNSVRSMLEAGAKRGYHVLTNRVVFTDGSCGAADQVYGQSAQLKDEGVPFAGQAVDLQQCPPVKLPRLVITPEAGDEK